MAKIYRKRVKLKELLFLCVIINVANSALGDENQESIRIWGPGLEPHKIIMPARYFFIQAVDKNNNSLAGNMEKDFKVVIEGGTNLGKPCRIWSNILDRKDGSLIVRYKVYEACSNIKITVNYKGHHVAESPYIIGETVYPDDCPCPVESIENLLHIWQCGNMPSQISKDFEPFDRIDWEVMRDKVIKQFDKPHSVSLCHYIIKNNQIHRKCYGKYVGFNMFSDNILLSLARKAKLPDLEFFVNLGDWPLSTQVEKYPILSWCGSTDSNDIVLPTYELTESALENMGRVMLDMLSVQGNVENTWENRQPKLFWRGRDSNRHRLDLIDLSRKHPELFNASLTNFFFFRDEEETYGPKSDYVSFFRFFEYKYQLAIDGTVAAYRMPFLLGGGSLVFKPHSKYYEYFYNDLEPYVHYIPVNTDLSDLIEKILWARDHDSKAKTIAQNAQQFANEHLLPQHVFCYHMHLLSKLKNVTTSKIRLLHDMELVNQKKDITCDCKRLTEGKKDEL